LSQIAGWAGWLWLMTVMNWGKLENKRLKGKIMWLRQLNNNK
jgi:hypothetical protein